jgi:ABC-type microcin C transport system duplicated ATPase subunit YejF
MKVWRPGTSAPEEAILLDAGSGDKISSFNPNSNMSLMQQRQRLPIFQWRNHILWAVENFQTLVLVGETGCGKSTQIPQVDLFSPSSRFNFFSIFTKPVGQAEATKSASPSREELQLSLLRRE